MRELDALQFYLPAVVAQHISQTDRNEDGLLLPTTQKFDEIVCLFADVSGFTALTEELCSLGPNGLEDLSMNLNKFVTQLIKIISKSGGDVLKFAGDAVMALWPEIDPNDYPTRVKRAVQCATDIQLRLDKFIFSVYEKDIDYRDQDVLPNGKLAPRREFMLRAKLGLGAGRLNIMHLGGNGDLIQRERYEYIAIGPALADAIESENCAKPGQVVITKGISAMLGADFYEAERTVSGGRIVVKAMKERVVWKAYNRSIDMDAETERKLWKYVPNAVMPYLLETNDEFWAPELRTVTTLFFNLGLDMDDVVDGAHTDVLAKVFTDIQNVVLSYEGTINKVLIDDKGATLIAVFGLPPFGHEDDPLRGVLSALSVISKLSKSNLQGAVGVSTGLAFCGIIGHATGNRREYSAIGDTVNLAARLMQNARSRKSAILIDSDTKGRLNDTKLDFIPGSINVKGKREPVHCYQIGAGKVAHDYHSVQLARLGDLRQQYNIVMLNKNKQKTRRRNTRMAVTSPSEMSALEAEQVQSFNDTSGFMQKKRRAKARLHGKRHDAAPLVSEAERIRASHSRLAAPGGAALAGGAGDGPVAHIRYRKEKNAPEVDTRVVVASIMETVLDLTVVAIQQFEDQREIEPEGADAAFYELVWVRNEERTTLKPDRELATLPFSSSEALDLILVRFESRRDIIASMNGPDVHGAEHIHERLAMLQDNVLSGNGTHLVLLSGDHGVGKTHLVENFLLSDEGSVYDEGEAIFAYARGNPFETGQRARPFAVWAHLMNDLLKPTEHGVQAPTREAGIVEALKAARRIYGPEEVPEEMDDSLYLLNKILGTDFPTPSDASGAGSSASLLSTTAGGSSGGSLAHARPQPKQTKKAFGLAKSRTVTQNGKPTRVQALGVLWRPHNEAQATGGAEPPSGSTRKRASLLRRLSRKSSSLRNGIDAFVADPESQSITHILAAILGGLATRIPLTIVVDESQYLDTFSLLVFQELAESWRKSNMFIILLRRLTRMERPALLQTNGLNNSAHERVSMFRPTPVKMHATLKDHLHARSSEAGELENVALLYERLKVTEGVEDLELKARPSNTFDIICNFAKVEGAPDTLVSFLRARTRGNPRYIVDAVSLYSDAGLIVRETSSAASRKGPRESTLVFPDEEFERLINIRAVPIPTSVEAIVGSLVDKMTLVQQLIIKVASIIGEVFTLELIKAIFPVQDLADLVSDAFEELADAGIVVYHRRDQALYDQLQVRDKINFSFESGWMQDIMLHRMLNKQKLKLNTKLKRVQDQQEVLKQREHLRQAMGKLEPNYSGFLQIRKENARNIMNPWKPRWCRLHKGKLVQYHDKDESKDLETIVLEPTSEVKTEPIGFFGMENRPAPLFCFAIRTSHWVKKGKARGDPRTFVLGCENAEERVQWLFHVQYAIDLLKIQDDDGVGAGGEPGSQRSLHRARGGDSGIRSFPAADELEEAGDFSDNEEVLQPCVAAEPADRGRAGKGKMFKAVFGHGSRTSDSARHQRKPSMLRRKATHAPSVPAGVPGVNYGVRIGPMEPEAFAEINKPEHLALFWEQPDSQSKHKDTVPVQASEVYFDSRPTSYVSYNSEDEIDGYLIGKIQTNRRNQEVGVILFCAVLPWARRRHIGSKLYNRFFMACRLRNCRFVSCNVDAQNSICLHFHRSLNFAEDEEQTRLLSRAGDDDKACLRKDLYGGDEDEFDEENPIFASIGQQAS